ncbi:hypothetical protein [Streptomyces sp. NPDC020951]|uniref:hypothetical protein n=1 Tax=Streptomyces sp. NPDC020951 TaxID=3365104 RepID=UPI00379420A3
MRHALSIEKDIREKPTTGPWKEYEPAGTAAATCSCGFATGTIATAEASRLARAHLDELKTPRADAT